MTVALTQAEAQVKIDQIESARDDAVKKLGQIRDTQEQMMSGSWHGGSATKYNGTMQQHHEEFDQLIATLTEVVSKGSAHIKSVASTDNE